MRAQDMKTVESLRGVPIKGDADGTIQAFGTFLQILPVNFWNSFMEKLWKAAPEAGLSGIESAVETAAAEYGYHAGHRIMVSREFLAAAGAEGGPEPEALLRGAFALLSAWGWADAEIAALTPPAKMVVHAWWYFEAGLRDTFPPPRPAAHVMRGVCRAFMDLAYARPYPEGLGSYACRQTRALELGDSYGEFVVVEAG
jgi:hypothetical protein